MTLTLELEPAIEARVKESAAHAGMDEAEYARKLIEEGLADRPMTGAEALEYWERAGARGVFADGPDSPELARQWRAAEDARLGGGSSAKSKSDS